jgi:hypothetical protein
MIEDGICFLLFCGAVSFGVWEGGGVALLLDQPTPDWFSGL